MSRSLAIKPPTLFKKHFQRHKSQQLFLQTLLFIHIIHLSVSIRSISVAVNKHTNVILHHFPMVILSVWHLVHVNVNNTHDNLVSPRPDKTKREEASVMTPKTPVCCICNNMQNAHQRNWCNIIMMGVGAPSCYVTIHQISSVGLWQCDLVRCKGLLRVEKCCFFIFYGCNKQQTWRPRGFVVSAIEISRFVAVSFKYLF